MKTLIIILLTSILNVANSQDSRIFENTWYLTNIIVNGNNNLPPNNNMNINFSSPTNCSALSCNTLNAYIAFANNITNFSATNYSYSLEICTNTLAYNYQSNFYFPFFNQGNIVPNIVYNFTHNITESQGIRTLVINSSDNKQAIYSSVQLSSDNFDKLDFSFTPNPSIDYIEIKISENISENIILEFYNEIGQICKTINFDKNNSKIELYELISGIYFVKIKTKNEIIIKKLIKL